MKLAYLYPEHFGLPVSRLLQTTATIRALLRQDIQMHLLIGWFFGLNKRLVELGLRPNNKLFIEQLPMWQFGPGLPIPFSWHSPYNWAAKNRLAYLASKGLNWILVRHLKLANYLLNYRSFIKVRILFEVHELFSETAREEACSISVIKKLCRMEARVFSHVDCLVAISTPLAQVLESMPKVRKPVLVVPSGVENSFFSTKSRVRWPNLIAYTGGLKSWKGVDLLFWALSLLPLAKLEILGNEKSGTANWQRLKKLAKDLKIESRLIMRPYASQSQVRELLGRASVAVWPGSGKQRIAAEFTSPLKLFEYLAAGCAVVVPNLPAARWILKNGIEAVFFTPDNYQALAEAIARLLNNPIFAANIAKSGRLLARSYTWDKRAQKLIKLMVKLDL